MYDDGQQDEQQMEDDRMAAEAHQQELEQREQDDVVVPFHQLPWHEQEEWARWHREITEMLDADPGYHAWLNHMELMARTDDAILEG